MSQKAYYPEYEQIFQNWEQENGLVINDHCRAVMINACRTTGVRMEDLLDDSMRDDIMYAKHLLRYALVSFMGYSATNLRNMLGMARSSVENSVKYIGHHMGREPRIQKDVDRMKESLMG